jgi:hypothetical protein
MNGRRLRAAAAVCGLMLVGGVVASAPAAAQPLEKGRFHDVFTEFFDCDGTPTQLDADVFVNFNAVRHGSSGLVFFRESLRGTFVYTNLNTGGTFTIIQTVNSRDAQVIDNGDGTLTIVVHVAGGLRAYDTDGNFVLADPGPDPVPVHGRHRRHPGRSLRRRGDRGNLPDNPGKHRA